MHWLVSLEAADALGHDVPSGKTRYLSLCGNYRRKLYDAIRESRSVAGFRTSFKSLSRGLESDLRKQPAYDEISCFSAYTLGACGPDFWTLMSKETFPPSGAHTAGIHFDFGHYNRSHHQFKVSGDRLRATPSNQWNLNQRAEHAYFAGMATHFATDLVLHQLVNVYAGAYNLLESYWENEHGKTTWIKNLWSTHNKVEHYWDTFVRYRWLGDYGAVWEDEGSAPVRTSGLPLADTIVRDAPRLNSVIGREIAKIFADQDAIGHDVQLAGPKYHIGQGHQKGKTFDERRKINEKTEFSTNIRYLLERLICFPRIFCDRVLARDGMQPFIWDVVVDKDSGAYPTSDVYPVATNEASSEQMADMFNGGRNEGNKLKTFSSRTNLGDAFNSFNFQVYFMCPRLPRLRQYGPTVFWEPRALGPFLSTANTVARQFVSAFDAFARGNRSDLGVLEKFWNLDTGLGLEVRNVHSASFYEVRTRIRLPHVTEVAMKKIDHSRRDAHLGGKKKTKSFDLPSKYGFNPKTPAFDTHDGGPFPTSQDVREETTARYLRTIETENEHGAATRDMKVREFFGPSDFSKMSWTVPAPTDSVEAITEIEVLRPLSTRLTLEFEIPIARLGHEEVTGFALFTDRDGAKAKPQEHVEHAGKTWMKPKEKKSQCLRYVEYDGSNSGPDVTEGSQCVHFTGRLLGNLDVHWAKDRRELEEGKWNNVIDPADVSKFCGRNIAVSTCRKNVLKPKGDGDFWANRDFDYYSDLSPTEQVFLTLFALVRAPNGCFDVFTGDSVTYEQFSKLVKIRCVGFVPVVLLYVCDFSGRAQLDYCYIDGLQTPVRTIPK